MDWKPLNKMEDNEVLRAEPKKLDDPENPAPCCVYKGPQRKSTTFVTIERSIVSGKVITETTYTLDALGRRETPQVIDPENYILMFGDSFTLGIGVEGKYTAPSQLAALRPRTQVYNYGLSGGSPNGFLHELQKNPAGRIVPLPPRPMTVLYTFMDHHVERLICRSNCVGTWMANSPYYTFENGSVHFEGFFKKNRFWRNAIYSLISKSALLSYFDVVWPLQITQNDIDFFAAMMV